MNGGDNVPATRKYVECRQRIGDHRKLTGWQRVGNQVNLNGVSTYQKLGNTGSVYYVSETRKT